MHAPPVYPMKPFKLLDYGTLEGGLVRMMERFRETGTLTGDPDEDAFLRARPEAALLGLLFDQRVRAEFAFTGPHRLFDRLGHLDLPRIAAMDPDTLRARFAEAPAVHRFTNRMADLTRGVAAHITEHYDGRAQKLWDDGADFPTIQRRAIRLPGFGKQKAMKLRFVLHYLEYRDFSD